MAFLREYIHNCDHGCGRKSALELLTFRNDLYGRYCRTCAPRMLRLVQSDEQAHLARERAPQPRVP